MTVSRKFTIREIAEELNIAYGSAQGILVNDLGLRRVVAKLVPKDLNFMQKRDFWTNNSWILHQDNAPSRNAIVIREHLAKNETNTIQQPPNSPDLVPWEFFLFGRLKKPLRGTRYSTRDEVMEKSKIYNFLIKMVLVNFVISQKWN